MIRNYLKTAIRHLRHYKSYSLINLTGMSVGLASTIIIFSFVSHEISYDRFHENHGLIYRIGTYLETAGDHSINAPVSMGRMHPLLQDAIEDIRYVTRVEMTDVDILYENQRFFNNKRLIVDSSFLDIFSFRIIEGNAIDPLARPGMLVITAALAEKIFGSRSPVGEIVEINNRKFEISAVTENVPANSHIRFDLLMSFGSLSNEDDYIDNRGFSFYSYLLLEEWADPEESLARARSFISEMYDQYFQGMGFKAVPFFQPLGRVHLYSEDLQFEMEPGGKISNVYIFSILAAFILIIAIVNHVNLVTARSETRSREVALRKIAGGSRRDLITQFISESFAMTLISLTGAIVIAELLVTPFGNLLNRELEINWLSAGPLLFAALVTLVAGLGAGAYPALYLSGFSPLKIFHKQSGSRPGNRLKVVLVIFQFSVATFLITCLVTIHSQVKYMQTKSLGFNKENILIIENISSGLVDNYSSVKEELLRNTAIVSVTASEGRPGRQATIQNSWPAEGNRDEAIMIYENRVQDDYFETYQMTLVEGRFFNSEMESDKDAFVINEAAARALGLRYPVGEDIYVWESRGTIIGVVSDFHFESLHEPVKPIAHSRYSRYFGTISLRISGDEISQTIDFAGEVLLRFDPDYVYSYGFLDDRLNRMYEPETRSNMLISMAAILSIVLSVMGLYSLTSFTILRKTKEIGIRKALGSSISSVLIMLYRDMGQWVLLSNLIAWPAAWYVMKLWLENFAYRIEPAAWLFILSGSAALLVAMLTITGLAVKAASTNPVEALRYE